MSGQPTAFDSNDLVNGIDVSHNNANIDWKTVAADGIAFAFTKATEGKNFQDPQFNANYAAMKANSIIRGAYHFFRPSADAKAQAENLLEMVHALEAGDLPPALDVEVNDNQTPSAIISGIQLWLDVVGAALKCKPIIYTSASFWNANLNGTAQFAEHPLWVAHYTSKPQPNIPMGFSRYTIWQFSEQGVVKGIKGNVDLDRFNGSLDQLRTLAGF